MSVSTYLGTLDPEGDGETENKALGTACTGPWAKLITLIGYTISLANIWRFPYIALLNGGGKSLMRSFLTPLSNIYMKFHRLFFKDSNYQSTHKKYFIYLRQLVTKDF